MAEEKKTAAKAKKEAPAKEAPKEEKAPKAKKEKTVKEKKAKEEAPKVEKPKATEASCFSRDIRITPRKVRLVADLVRGKDVAVALGLLAQTNRVAASPVAKAIRSAAANAVNNFGMDEKKLYISEIQVGDGLKIKRYIPRAKGSASSIIKRNANLRVKVRERE